MASGITFTFIGINETILNLNRMSVELMPIIAGALNQEHETIMTMAKERTPVLTGALRSSGHIVQPRITGRTVKSLGAFGGTAAPYAVRVHENLSAFHSNGRSKFYESASLERKGKVKFTIKGAISRYLASRAI
jgi:hypothetical protein